MQTLVKPTRSFPNTALNQYRQQGDAPADAVIAAVVATNGPAGLRSLMSWLTDTTDFITASQHPAVQDFFASNNQLPAWADSTTMSRGMRFFQKNAQQIGLILGFFSLPYSYLGANGAQVLWLTERIKNDTVRRLRETGEWVFAVNNEKEWSSGKAIARTVKIRLIHAGARWFSLHSGRWNMDWGYPVNQEDMAGTNLAFSYIVLLGLRKIGIQASEQDEEAYLHHSNVISYLNGVTGELLPKNLREAFILHQAILRRQFAPSEAGVGLTRALLNAMTDVLTSPINLPNSPIQFSSAKQPRSETIRNLVAGEIRFFLGDKYADWLDVPQVPIEKRMVDLLNRFSIFPL
ncbi:oxygenase MpaB family protein [Spirosoma gilvum]